MLGLDNIGMKEVARLTIIQSLCSTAAAGLAHHRARFVHAPLVRWMAPVIFIASMFGAILSERQFISAELLLGLFASLAFLSTLFLVAAKDTGQEDQGEVTNSDMSFSRQWAVTVASVVGFLGGMVGQSGAFMTIPLLVQVLRIPMRVAIGSSLAITFSAALAGSFGKLAGGGQVVWLQIGALATGSLMGSQLGTAFSCRLPVFYLRYGLAILIAIAAARMWYEVIT